MKIDFFADTTCPWCYLGLHRLRAVIDDHKARAEIRWRSFQLHPGLPAAGMDRRQHLLQRFGSAEAAERIHGAIGQAALAANVPIDLARAQRIPNTLRSHRLIRFAAGDGMAAAVAEAVMRAYLAEGRDIGDPMVLADIADTCGLDHEQTTARLASNGERAEVVDDERLARGLGIAGVPFMLFDERYAVAGVQPPEILRLLLQLGEDSPRD